MVCGAVERIDTLDYFILTVLHGVILQLSKAKIYHLFNGYLHSS